MILNLLQILKHGLRSKLKSLRKNKVKPSKIINKLQMLILMKYIELIYGKINLLDQLMTINFLLLWNTLQELFHFWRKNSRKQRIKLARLCL